MTFSFQKLTPFLWLLAVWIVLLGLTVTFSRDYFAYYCWFDDALNLPIIERVSGANGYFRDLGYFGLQALGTVFLPFEIFFALLIFISLILKLFALLQLNPRPSLLEAVPYLLVLSFLHEGTQVRVGLALSIALWSIIWFAQDKRTQALLILCVAATFHLSVVTFFLVFMMLLVYERLGLWIFLVIAILAAVLAYSSIVKDLILTLGEATNARYMVYSVGALYRRQNSSGLFQYFSLFVVALTILVWQLHHPTKKVWQELKKIALISGFLAVIILQVFRFNVVIASRIADLLLLPLVLALGSALIQLQRRHQKALLGGILIFLIAYASARGFLTYKPVSGATKFCHPELQPNYDPENP